MHCIVQIRKGSFILSFWVSVYLGCLLCIYFQWRIGANYSDQLVFNLCVATFQTTSINETHVMSNFTSSWSLSILESWTETKLSNRQCLSSQSLYPSNTQSTLGVIHKPLFSSWPPLGLNCHHCQLHLHYHHHDHNCTRNPAPHNPRWVPLGLTCQPCHPPPAPCSPRLHLPPYWQVLNYPKLLKISSFFCPRQVALGSTQ